MNTPAHLIVAAALFCRPTRPHERPAQQARVNAAALAGADTGAYAAAHANADADAYTRAWLRCVPARRPSARLQPNGNAGALGLVL